MVGIAVGTEAGTAFEIKMTKLSLYYKITVNRI